MVHKQQGGVLCIRVLSSDLYRVTEHYTKNSTKRILRLQSQASQRWEMPANCHTHLGCLHYDTTPSYTTAYHLPLNKLTPFFVLSYLFHLKSCSLLLHFFPAPFSSLLPPQQAAEHGGDHHLTGSVSRENACKKALLCFRLSVHNTNSVWPVRRHARDRAHSLEIVFLLLRY